ncbi:helix-turn-helix domain-containing protein [Streptomyces caatingaensis]|uniref:HTH cro/C1-type domain-containing protein n=1 Tax=Streptomyces caatingaensis TaxID=1678637 RepID=A0A0K9XKA4_9ACTN|nr:helix-turn-helix domain-containing protein [Streptomyces caatingaensis]KNB53723.1 hypothetical protein AC230_03705 [Streptomyces caatingaensis]
MHQGGGTAEPRGHSSLEERINAAKGDIARRLRYIRHHHPDGPFTLAGLAERAGVSKRTLSHAESADGSNLTLETLLKVCYSLGIARDAYFLDEQVFQQVNMELEASSGREAGCAAHVDLLCHLLTDIADSAAQARGVLRALPPEQRRPPGRTAPPGPPGPYGLS